MKVSRFKVVRCAAWCVIIALLFHVFITSPFDPSRAEIRSETEGVGVYMIILWNNVYAMIPSMFLFTAGIVCMFILYSLRKALPHKMLEAMLCLGEFILAAAIWVLTDSHFLSLITSKNSEVALISYLSFTVMFAFLFEFINYVLEKKKAFSVLCIIIYILAVLEVIYFIWSFMPIELLIVPVHCTCVAGAIMLFVYGYAELTLHRKTEIRYIIHGFVWLIGFGAIALSIFYINSLVHYSIYYSIGICIFCIYLVIAALAVVKKQIEKDASESAYRKLAYTDVMTGLMNKAAYIEEEKKPLTKECIYLMMDINDLKKINDQYGHQKGDEVIVAAAGYIRKYFDKALCYRFGGDEFIVICREYSIDQVEHLIYAMRNEMKTDNVQRDVPVEIAIGYSIHRPQDTVADMFKRADTSMYEDKALQKAGR